MLSAELAYRIGVLRRIVLKITGKSIHIVFILAALATLSLMAYKFGYAVSDNEQKWIKESFQIILRIFFYGSIANMALEYKNIWREKGFWVEIIVLMLLLFCIVTRQSVSILSHLLLLFISIIQLSKVIVITFQRHIRPEIMFACSFFILIFTGAALLMLPKAHGLPLAFTDALFTSTSAVCITGLTTVDIATTFTFTGQMIILLLIQIGGIGIMTFTSFIALSFFTQTSFNDQIALKNILNEDSMNNIFRTLFYIFFTTLFIEAIGTWAIWWEVRHISRETVPNPVFFAAFHAISAFCNAGFSTLSDNLYHPAVRHLYGFQTWLSILIILGGIGFPIVFNYGKLINHKIRNGFYRLTGSSKRMPSHVRIVNTTTRTVIVTTAILLLGGALLFWCFEYDTLLKGLPLRGQLAVSLLGSATTRTAGFNAFPMQALSAPTLTLMMFLMWIGASPMSTGGGIKTTTFAIAWKSIFSTLKNKDHVEIFKRRIPDENMKRAYAIILLSVIWIFAATLTIAALQPQARVSDILFEVISAISTVGLSIDFTPQLNTAGKIVICLTMFIGRVGLITLLSGMTSRQTVQNYTYAEENVIL